MSKSNESPPDQKWEEIPKLDTIKVQKLDIIKGWTGIILILIALSLLILKFLRQNNELFLEFIIYFIASFGGVLIGSGWGKKYRSQWIKKRDKK